MSGDDDRRAGRERGSGKDSVVCILVCTYDFYVYVCTACVCAGNGTSTFLGEVDSCCSICLRGPACAWSADSIQLTHSLSHTRSLMFENPSQANSSKRAHALSDQRTLQTCIEILFSSSSCFISSSCMLSSSIFEIVSIRW
jgi:hypothetical protein